MGRLEEGTGFFSGKVVNKCGSMCVSAIYKGADFTGGLHISEGAGAFSEKTRPVCKSSSFFVPLTPPSIPALHGVGAVTQRSNPRQLKNKTWNVTALSFQGFSCVLCCLFEPKLLLEPGELRETTWSKAQWLLESPDSFSCANKRELGWRAAHISIGPQSLWWSRPGHFTHSGGTVGTEAQPACSRTLRTTWQTSCCGEERLKDEGFEFLGLSLKPLFSLDHCLLYANWCSRFCLPLGSTLQAPPEVCPWNKLEDFSCVKLPW